MAWPRRVKVHNTVCGRAAPETIVGVSVSRLFGPLRFRIDVGPLGLGPHALARRILQILDMLEPIDRETFVGGLVGAVRHGARQAAQGDPVRELWWREGGARHLPLAVAFAAGMSIAGGRLWRRCFR